MKEAGGLAVGAALTAWLLWNVWNLLHLVFGPRDGTWRRPVWWVRVCSVSLFAGLASWVWGAFQGGLDVGEACALAHQPYDGDYRRAHPEEFDRLFPLSNKCNAHYDLVPAWVNPTVVGCAVVFLAAVVVLLWFAVARLTGPGGVRRPFRGDAARPPRGTAPGGS